MAFFYGQHIDQVYIYVLLNTLLLCITKWILKLCKSLLCSINCFHESFTSCVIQSQLISNSLQNAQNKILDRVVSVIQHVQLQATKGTPQEVHEISADFSLPVFLFYRKSFSCITVARELFRKAMYAAQHRWMTFKLIMYNVDLYHFKICFIMDNDNVCIKILL